MVTYLRGLPRELAEAARIDGASSFAILTRIVIPLAWPGIVVSGIVVSGIVAFLLGWNDVLLASVMTRPDTQTAAVALQVFGATKEGGAIPIYGQMMAALLPRSARTGWRPLRCACSAPPRQVGPYMAQRNAAKSNASGTTTNRSRSFGCERPEGTCPAGQPCLTHRR